MDEPIIKNEEAKQETQAVPEAENAADAGTPGKKTDAPLLKLLMVLAAAVLIVLIIVIRNRPAQPEPTAPAAEQTGTLADTEGKFQTPVGELVFPAEWADAVRLEENKGDPYSAAFYTKTEEQELLLFRLYVGEKGTGYELGAAPDTANRLCPVWLDISAVEDDPERSEEETRRLNTIQSCVNDLIDQIYALPGYQDPA